jgi:hypothetical protein
MGRGKENKFSDSVKELNKLLSKDKFNKANTDTITFWILNLLSAGGPHIGFKWEHLKWYPRVNTGYFFIS